VLLEMSVACAHAIEQIIAEMLISLTLENIWCAVHFCNAMADHHSIETVIPIKVLLLEYQKTSYLIFLSIAAPLYQLFRIICWMLNE
jgi:hypothetical protein